jgi:hypothetical protein
VNYGYVKSYNAERRIGMVEQTIGPDVPFILGEGDFAPEVGQQISFTMFGRAGNIRVERQVEADVR